MCRSLAALAALGARRRDNKKMRSAIQYQGPGRVGEWRVGPPRPAPPLPPPTTQASLRQAGDTSAKSVGGRETAGNPHIAKLKFVF